MTPLLEIENLRYSYPDGTPALKGISLEIAPGENLTLFGPNGSGKTTFLLHLNGTLAGEGMIRIGGISVSKETTKEIRRQVGIVFQDPDSQLFMPTVIDDVMFGLLNMGWSEAQARSRARFGLEQVGLRLEDGDRPPFHLSAGEKRRVALAGVLVMEPKLLILDEPTSWLDPPGQRGLIDLLKGLPQPKIIATHDAAFAAALSTRAVFLAAGRVLADGPILEIIDRFDWRC
jgi:cobalt/nickel transport system ATP-binding protein